MWRLCAAVARKERTFSGFSVATCMLSCTSHNAWGQYLKLGPGTHRGIYKAVNRRDGCFFHHISSGNREWMHTRDL